MRDHEWTQDTLIELIRWRFVLELGGRREPSLLDELESSEHELWQRGYAFTAQVLQRTEECRDRHLLGTISASEFVARIAFTCAAVLHQSDCRKPKDTRRAAPLRFCSDEATLIQDLVSVLCRALDVTVKASLLDRIVEIVSARRVSLEQAIDALSGAISHKITFGVLATRPMPAIQRDRPNVIINVPRSLLATDEAEDSLSRAGQLAEVVETRGLRAYITAQWPKPNGQSDGQRTSQVMTPMHYASAIFTVTQKGWLGTAQSIAFAEEHAIPSLIIDTPGDERIEYRNPGGWTHRQRVQSNSIEDDLQAASEFLDTFCTQIWERNRSLSSLGDFQVPPSRPTDWISNGVEPTVFATSWVPYVRVCAILNDDLVWHQTPLIILREIAYKLGRLRSSKVMAAQDLTPDIDRTRHRDWLEFFTTFVGFAETRDLDYDQMGRLMTSYFRAENQSPISARDDVQLHTKDWQSLLNNLPDDDE